LADAKALNTTNDDETTNIQPALHGNKLSRKGGGDKPKRAAVFHRAQHSTPNFEPSRRFALRRPSTLR
jgi:hypothetical protein